MIVDNAVYVAGRRTADPESLDETFEEAEDTIGIPVAQLQAAASTADGTTLWDPLPMTLPTYVSAPKAKRTVRTIDLGQPGTWTSGRTAEDAEIAALVARPTSAARELRSFTAALLRDACT